MFTKKSLRYDNKKLKIFYTNVYIHLSIIKSNNNNNNTFLILLKNCIQRNIFIIGTIVYKQL